MIVNENGSPCVISVTDASLVTDRSAVSCSVSTSVALLFDGSGSTTPGGTVAVTTLVSTPAATAVWTVTV